VGETPGEEEVTDLGKGWVCQTPRGNRTWKQVFRCVTDVNGGYRLRLYEMLDGTGWLYYLMGDNYVRVSELEARMLLMCDAGEACKILEARRGRP